MDTLPHLCPSCCSLAAAEGRGTGCRGPCPSEELAGPPVQLQGNPNGAVSGDESRKQCRDWPQPLPARPTRRGQSQATPHPLPAKGFPLPLQALLMVTGPLQPGDVTSCFQIENKTCHLAVVFLFRTHPQKGTSIKKMTRTYSLQKSEHPAEGPVLLLVSLSPTQSSSSRAEGRSVL